MRTAPTPITHANWSAVDTPEFRNGFDQAVAHHLSLGERTWDLLIGGEHRRGSIQSSHLSPGDAAINLGPVAQATSADVDDAVSVAHAGYPRWRATPPEERVALLRTVADRIEACHFELAGLISLEIGKNRFEARTEVEEAIELLRFYCDSMVAQHDLVVEYPPLGKERSVSVGRPYGVWAVLGPFNFPFALIAGMAGAALVTGNTVVIKPPVLAPASGLRFAEICLEAGIPADVVGVVMGDADVGRALTGHALVQGVGFTGSMQVGHAIRKTLDGKPLVAEMGGKNPALVMPSADVEIAAEAISRSAFRYAGQKCSACSRVFVDRRLVDQLADRVIEHAREMRVGIPWIESTTVGPLISQVAKSRFDGALARAEADARRTLVTTLPEQGLADGAYTRSAIAVDLPRGHDLLTTELFAPLLCIQSVDSFDDAIALANDVPYGLTAGLYTGEEDEIKRFLDEMEAGVLYVNRVTGATTGAWVGHQSFGGWKGSGSTGANAHGAYYLQQFVREQSRTTVGS